MSVANDEAQLAALAERIGGLIGLPPANVQSLLPLIDAAELDRLPGLDDAELLKESTRLINQASSAAPPPATSSIEANAAAGSAAKPINSKSEKRLVLPKPDAAGASGLQVPQTDAEAPKSPAAAAPPAPPQPAAPEPPAPPQSATPKASITIQPEERASKSTNKIPTQQVPVVERAQLAVSDDGTVGGADDADDDVQIADERTREINTAFTASPEATEAAPKVDSKTKLMLAAAGGLALVILLLMGILAVVLLRGPQDAPEMSRPSPKKPAAKPVAAPPPVKQRPNMYAYKFVGSFEHEVVHETLFEGTLTGVTVEMWIRPSEIDKVKNFVVSNSGDRVQFRLGVGQRKGEAVAIFDVPRSTKGFCWGPMPTGHGWVHIAGVYDPEKAFLKLFINGREKSHKKCIANPRVRAIGYQLKGEVEEGHELLLDELRLSGTAVYSHSFRPRRVLKAQASTKSLLHFEKILNAAGKLEDAGRSGLKIDFSGGEFVEVDVEDFRIAVWDGSLELPAALLRQIRREYGDDDARKFQRDWEKFSPEEKRRLIKKFKDSQGL